MCIGEYRYGSHPPSPDIVCEIFARNGVSHLNFCGDSFVRHLYVATLHLLTGNRHNASLWPGHPPECTRHGQYEEKHCRPWIRPESDVCGGALRVTLDSQNWGVPWQFGRFDSADLVVWSGGNHPPEAGVLGQHDTAAVARHLLSRICPRWTSAQAARVVWVSTHARLGPPVRPGEAYEAIRAFNARMPAVVRAECGVRRHVDVFNMTVRAILRAPEVAAVTYDGVHWSSAVNLVKARLLLDHLLAPTWSRHANTAFINEVTPFLPSWPP